MAFQHCPLILTANEPASLSVFACFGVFTIVHLYASYRALSSLELNTLNLQRFSIVLDSYLKTRVLLSPAEVSAVERIIQKPIYAYKSRAIHLGASVRVALPGEEAGYLLDIFRGEDYLLNCVGSNIYVVLREGIGSKQLLKAYFHAYYFREILASNDGDTKAAIEDSLNFTNQNFETFLELLQKENWITDHLLLIPADYRAIW